MTDYLKDTKNAYKNEAKASSYFLQHHQGLTWARFVMALELKNVEKAFKFFNVGKQDTLLDVPCGTGVAAKVVGKVGCNVFAVDVSEEMLGFARLQYNTIDEGKIFLGDITNLKLPDKCVLGAIVLGFFHRTPDEIVENSLSELNRTSVSFVVASFAVDTPIQRIKRFMLSMLNSSYVEAPIKRKLEDIVKLFNKSGFEVCKINHPLPLLSSEVLLWAKVVETKKDQKAVK